MNNQEKTFEELKNEILENFDFEKVQKVMRALDWYWFTSENWAYIPSVVQLKEEAANTIYKAFIKRSDILSLNGFFAECNEEIIKLYFVTDSIEIQKRK